MNYYSKYPGDYLRDTPHLTLAQHGAYNLLLDYYYSRDGKAFPRDRRVIYRMLRADTPAEREAVDSVLDEFWFETADGWENQKANEVMAQVRVIQEKRRKAAQARWAKEKQAAGEAEADGMQVHMQMHSKRMSNQNQNQNQSQNQIKEEPSSCVSPSGTGKPSPDVPPDPFHAHFDPRFKNFMKELETTYPEHADARTGARPVRAWWRCWAAAIRMSRYGRRWGGSGRSMRRRGIWGRSS